MNSGIETTVVSFPSGSRFIGNRNELEEPSPAAALYFAVGRPGDGLEFAVGVRVNKAACDRFQPGAVEYLEQLCECDPARLCICSEPMKDGFAMLRQARTFTSYTLERLQEVISFFEQLLKKLFGAGIEIFKFELASVGKIYPAITAA